VFVHSFVTHDGPFTTRSLAPVSRLISPTDGRQLHPPYISIIRVLGRAVRTVINDNRTIRAFVRFTRFSLHRSYYGARSAICAAAVHEIPNRPDFASGRTIMSNVRSFVSVAYGTVDRFVFPNSIRGSPTVLASHETRPTAKRPASSSLRNYTSRDRTSVRVFVPKCAGFRVC